MNTFSIKAAIQFGWTKTKENLGYLAGVVLILIVSSMVLSAFSSIPVLGFIITMAGQTIIGIGSVKLTLALMRGEKLPYKTLFTTIDSFWRFLGSSLLTAVVVALGMILFIIPGIILALALSLVKFIVVDTDKGVVDSMKYSMEITKGNRWKILGFALVAALLNAVGGLFFGVGLLITIPITMMASAYIYDKLANHMEITKPVESAVVTPPVPPTVEPPKPTGESAA